MLSSNNKLIAHIMLVLYTINAITIATSSSSSTTSSSFNGSSRNITAKNTTNKTNGQNLNSNIVLMLANNSSNSSDSKGNTDIARQEKQHQQHSQNNSVMVNSREDLHLNEFNSVATTPRIIIPSTKPPNRYVSY